jgi:hypothetical protein
MYFNVDTYDRSSVQENNRTSYMRDYYLAKVKKSIRKKPIYTEEEKKQADREAQKRFHSKPIQ